MSFESPEELRQRKRLEWELSLGWADIRSNGWFHGPIGRSVAEQLLKIDGQFLVRDCSTRTGDYVLSCRHYGHYLHFVISKVIQQPNTVYERIQYTFEDECFDTIRDLITYYVGNKKPISRASNAVITTPVNRTVALSDWPLIQSNKAENQKSQTDLNWSESSCSDGPPPKPPKPSRTASKTYDRLSDNTIVNENISNIGFDCNDCTENSEQESNQNGSDGSEDSAFFSNKVSPKQTVSDNYSRIEPADAIRAVKWLQILTIPSEMSSSFIRAENFQTYLLPKDNKPLEATTITKVESVLLDSGARILANHLTKCDLEFIKHLDRSHDFGLGIGSALELIILPHGEQMRLDLLERHECLKYFVAISVLTANSDRNRAIVLNKWIEIAIETKTALGDLFGFAAIMEALSMSPIVKLKTLWSFVRKDFTENAIIYETKLRPQLKSMSECNEPQAPNTTFPFILTLVQILQRHTSICRKENDPNGKLPSLDLLLEQTAVDYGLQQIYSHLEEASHMIDQLANYRRNGQIVLDGCLFEELLCDMFRTEFHRQFLFGYRGSVIDGQQRFEKLDQIIMALARKCEPDIDPD